MKTKGKKKVVKNVLGHLKSCGWSSEGKQTFFFALPQWCRRACVDLLTIGRKTHGVSCFMPVMCINLTPAQIGQIDSQTLQIKNTH